MEDGKYKTRCLEINSATIEEKRVRLEELFSAVIRHIEEYLNDCNINIVLSEHEDQYEWWAQLEIRPTQRAADAATIEGMDAWAPDKNGKYENIPSPKPPRR